MKKIIIFGNSGSGKSTLAKKYQAAGLAHLDLDTIAWDMNPGPVRKPISESAEAIQEFVDNNAAWVIEGCYADLLEIAAEHATEVVFMNLDVELCIANARSRPWEPHKYDSKETQDKNLAMLIDWIRQYPDRTDAFSKAAHEKLYADFKGNKKMYVANEIVQP